MSYHKNAYRRKGTSEWRSQVLEWFFTAGWYARGAGKFWKRRYHKAMRQEWRNGGRERSVTNYGSTCNWKNW